MGATALKSGSVELPKDVSSEAIAHRASAAAHAAGHLQILGVGDWAPRSTNPGWADDARVDDNPPSDSSDETP